MRIGIHFSGVAPQLGGAFTFEQMVIEAILEEAPHSPHQVTLISRRRVHSDWIMGVDFLKLPTETPSNTRRVRVPRLLGKTAVSEPVESRLGQHGFDFVINLLPWDPFSADVPYLAIVLDLQHRLQPFFPEVSEAGVWEQRESWYARLLPRATMVITGTETGKREIQKFYSVAPERIHSIPLPVPDDIAEARRNAPSVDVLTKYKLPQRYLFYPAQFWPHKNHAGLLLAVHALKLKNGTEVPVVLAGGDQGNKSYIQSLAKHLGIERQIFFLDFVPRSDLLLLYKHALALVYVSFFGPDNFPPLEAFGLGCPVIAADVSGAKEQLGDAALLVDPASPEAIAQAVYKFLTQESLRADFIRRGIQRKPFTGKLYAERLFSIIDEFETVRRTWPNSSLPVHG